jgi:hypothetical protein
VSRIGVASVVLAIVVVSSSSRAEPVDGSVSRDEPYVAVSFGLTIRHLPRNPAAGTASRSTSPTMVEPAGSDTIYSFVQQYAAATTRHSYIGLEVEIAPNPDEGPEPDAGRMAAGAHGVFGIMAGTQHVRLGADVAGGLRLFENDDEKLMLETRVRGDIWLTPWVTLGAAVGTSLVDRGDWVTAIYIGMHTDTFTRD